MYKYMYVQVLHLFVVVFVAVDAVNAVDAVDAVAALAECASSTVDHHFVL